MAIPARKPGHIARLNRAEVARTGTIWCSLLQEEGIARDLVGGQNIIAPGGSAIREPGRVATFNGSQVGKVDAALPGTVWGNYVIAARIRATAGQGGNPGQAFGLTYSTGDQGSIGVGFNSAANAVGQTFLHTNGAGLGAQRVATIGTWYTVYAQGETSIGGSQRAWVDGTPCTPVPGAGVSYNPTSITMGAQHRGSGYLRHFTGDIEWAAVIWLPQGMWFTDEIAAEHYESGYPYNLVARTKSRRAEPSAPTGITGDLTTTLGAATLSATGALAIKGALASTLANATLSAAGAVAVKGALSSTLANATLAAAGALPIKGTLSSTLADATLSAAGTLPLKGALAKTLDDATLSAAGALQAQGSGSLAVTLANVTLASTGAIRIAGLTSATLANAVLSAAGVLPLKGVAAITLQNATLAAAGVLVVQGSGSLAQTLANATLSAQAVLALRGLAAVQLQDAALSAAGVLLAIPTGQLSVQLANAVLAATGLLQPMTGGYLSTQLQDAVLAAQGRLLTVGQSQILLEPAALDARGALLLRAQLAVTLADLILLATGRDPSTIPLRDFSRDIFHLSLRTDIVHRSDAGQVIVFTAPTSTTAGP